MTTTTVHHPSITADPTGAALGGPLHPPAARVFDAVKVYGRGENEVRALDGVSVEFATGRFTAIMGPSGSGKSTLMHSVAGLDHLTSGTVLIGDTDISKLDDRSSRSCAATASASSSRRSTSCRRSPRPRTSPSRPASPAARPTAAWFDHVVETVGLTNRLKHRPSELSGGQQQRVAVARALASRPEIIFADEPTGNLDSRTGAEILSFMRTAVREFGQTIVMVTHDPVAAVVRRPRRVPRRRPDRRRPRRPDRRLRPRPHPHPRRLIAMFRLTLKELAARKLRLLTTAFAVLLGVAFMAGTIVFTDTIGATFDSVLAEANEGVDAYVRTPSAIDVGYGEPGPRLDASLLDTVASVDGVDEVALRINGYAQLVGPDGEPVGDVAKNPAFGTNWVTSTTSTRTSWPAGTLPPTTTRSSSTRRAPTRPATSRATSRPCSPRASRGSSRSPASPPSAARTRRPGRRRCCSPTPPPPSCWRRPGEADAIAVTADSGCVAGRRRRRRAGRGRRRRRGHHRRRPDRGGPGVDGRASSRSWRRSCVVFAFVAVFVGAFIINNTFSITVAQRTREMAMLRAIGASGRQVKRSVLIEAPSSVCSRRRPVSSPVSASPPVCGC